jgi:cation:H+ antiporter
VAIGLTALAALAVLTPPGASLGWVGIDTVGIAGVYLAAVAWIRRSPLGRGGGPEVLPIPIGLTTTERGPVRPTVLRFAATTAVVLASAPPVAYTGREIAAASGLGETFVGTALVALSTSLPELVTSLAAVRIGAQDLAVGNLFGSNAVNMALLVLVDVAYRPGPLLAAIDAGQAVAAVGAIVLMALALALTAIVHGAETRIRRLEPNAVVLLLAYLGALFAVWRVRP